MENVPDGFKSMANQPDLYRITAITKVFSVIFAILINPGVIKCIIAADNSRFLWSQKRFSLVKGK